MGCAAMGARVGIKVLSDMCRRIRERSRELEADKLLNNHALLGVQM